MQTQTGGSAPSNRHNFIKGQKSKKKSSLPLSTYSRISRVNVSSTSTSSLSKPVRSVQKRASVVQRCLCSMEQRCKRMWGPVTSSWNEQWEKSKKQLILLSILCMCLEEMVVFVSFWWIIATETRVPLQIMEPAAVNLLPAWTVALPAP